MAPAAAWLRSLRRWAHLAVGWTYLLIALAIGLARMRSWLHAPYDRYTLPELAVTLLFVYFGVSSLLRASVR